METPQTRRPDGEIVVVTGSSGSGKTAWTMRAVARSARLLVWDSHLEWSSHGCTAIRTIPELVAACRTRDARQLAYIGPAKTFGAFSRIALCWAMLAPCSVVVEELADVTSPGKAPPGWGELLRWARKLGCRVYAITQRPSESDKTVLGNAHRIVCHAMGRARDRAYMAEELGVDVSEVASLDRTKLEHIERLPDCTTRRGRTPRPKSRPA